MKELQDTERVKIGDDTFVISSIPAFTAEMILLRAMGAIAAGNLAAMPPDVLLEILSYTAIVNKNGAEVQLENQQLIDTMVADCGDLIELESLMVKKNFGFLGDGRLNTALSRMTEALTPSRGSAKEGTPAT